MQSRKDRVSSFLTAVLVNYFETGILDSFNHCQNRAANKHKYLNKALNKVAEHSKDSMVLAPCFPAVERPFFPK